MTNEEIDNLTHEELLKLGYREPSAEERALLDQLAESKQAPTPELVAAPAAEAVPTAASIYHGLIKSAEDAAFSEEFASGWEPSNRNGPTAGKLSRMLGLTPDDPERPARPTPTSMRYGPDGEILLMADDEVAFRLQG